MLRRLRSVRLDMTAGFGVLHVLLQHKLSSYGDYLGSGLTGGYVVAVNYGWFRVARLLTEWENHPCRETHTSALTFVRTAPPRRAAQHTASHCAAPRCTVSALCSAAQLAP
eukprot:SAG11_NODE_1787_length_4257_cov_2.349928_5_plen_111_part_00